MAEFAPQDMEVTRKLDLTGLDAAGAERLRAKVFGHEEEQQHLARVMALTGSSWLRVIWGRWGRVVVYDEKTTSAGTEEYVTQYSTQRL